MGQLQHDGLHATAVLLVGFTDGNQQHREGTSGIVPSCLIVGDTECVVINLFHGSADDFYMRPVGGVVVSPLHVCAVGIVCLQMKRDAVGVWYPLGEHTALYFAVQRQQLSILADTNILAALTSTLAIAGHRHLGHLAIEIPEGIAWIAFISVSRDSAWCLLPIGQGQHFFLLWLWLKS